MSDDDLEIGIAAGLDVPTALAVSEKPRTSCQPLAVKLSGWILIGAVVVLALLWLLC
jgi:hypothetical protein